MKGSKRLIRKYRREKEVEYTRYMLEHPIWILGQIESGKMSKAFVAELLRRQFTRLGEIFAFQAMGDYIVQWRKSKKFRTHWGNVPEKLMLVVTELAEAMEAYRKIDPKTLSSIRHARRHGFSPSGGYGEWVDNFREELADSAIRLFDLAYSLGIDLGDEMRTKMKVNETREILHGKHR